MGWLEVGRFLYFVTLSVKFIGLQFLNVGSVTLAPYIERSLWGRIPILQYSARSGSLRQIFTYALIGAVINLLGYGLYIFLTHLGVTPKLTVTFLYVVGAGAGFFANRSFTFQHKGRIGSTSVRYLLAQFSGYLLNLLMLVVFVDWLGLKHQFVQALAIVVVAVFLFFLSRVFVFPSRTGEQQLRKKL